MNSDQLFKKSLDFVPGGVHSPVRSFKGLHQTPRFMNRAHGAYIIDEEQKEYIDFCMSFGPLILGHRNELVEKAVIDAISRGWSYGACEKYSLELAEFLINKIPHIDQIRFVNSGTEAVMTAVRLARGYTGKTKVIKFNGCYHGHLDGMLIKAGSGLAGEGDSSSAGVTKQMANDTLICELGDIEAIKEIFHIHKDDIACIVIEPLPANNGILIQEETFLKELRKLCNEYNSLLVFDEVISGFRVGFEGMAKDLNIIPDMVTYGKIIGGGFPVGAVAAKKEIMQRLAPVGDVYQAGTLSANPVAMAAGLANLTQLTPEFYSDLELKANNIVNIFKEWLAQSEFNDYNITQYKSLFWLVPNVSGITKPSQIPSNLADRFYKLFQHFSEKGIYLSPNAYEIGFVSSAHDENIQKELKSRLWS
jgi:glutamate-1-semialdehyde 2,1-aminomutase